MQKGLFSFGRIMLCSFCVGFCFVSACFLTPPDVTGWSCTDVEDCLSPLICDTDTKKCLLPCFDNKDCKVGQTCFSGFCGQKEIKDGAGAEKRCNPLRKELCNGIDDNCNGLIDDGINCAGEGELCDLSVQNPTFCGLGFVCASFTAIHPRVCLKLCSTNSSCSGSTDLCLSLRSGDLLQKVCVLSKCAANQSCRVGADHKIAYQCDKIAKTTNVCRPFYPSGSIPFGKECFPNNEKYCTTSLGCARRSSDPSGICTVFCQNSSDCEKLVKKGAKCLPFEGGRSICFPPCQADQDCPSKMSCRNKLCSFESN